MALRNETNPQQADYLQKIQSASESLLLIINDILDISKIEEKKLILESIPFELEALIQKVVSICSYKMGTKPLELMVDIAPGVKTSLMGDPLRLQQVLVNLVDNAIKYGGDSIEINLNSVLNVTEISVADNGKGIDKSQQERIFDKFYRVPKGNTHDVKGFGIGLYYAQKIIEKHNGSINISSSFDNTIFKLQIPNE
jgi:two-component system phosphate regulon sensor histidine kinase PhoR